MQAINHFRTAHGIALYLCLRSDCIAVFKRKSHLRAHQKSEKHQEELGEIQKNDQPKIRHQQTANESTIQMSMKPMVNTIEFKSFQSTEHTVKFIIFQVIIKTESKQYMNRTVQTETTETGCVDAAVQTESDFLTFAEKINQKAIITTPIRVLPVSSAANLSVHRTPTVTPIPPNSLIDESEMVLTEILQKAIASTPIHVPPLISAPKMNTYASANILVSLCSSDEEEETSAVKINRKIVTSVATARELPKVNLPNLQDDAIPFCSLCSSDEECEMMIPVLKTAKREYKKEI